MLLPALLLVGAEALQCLESMCPVSAVSDTQRADGVCDAGCMAQSCGYDGGDCATLCALKCGAGQLGNGNCDPGEVHSECDSVECGWDYGDCGVCGGGCEHHLGSEELLRNDVCDAQCNSLACQLDDGRCVSEANPDLLYVWTGSLPLDRSVYPWVANVKLALESVWADFTTVYLLRGTHEVADAVAVTRGVVTIATLLCPESECSESPLSLHITAPRFSVAVFSELRLANVSVRGLFPLRADCEECFFCPVASLDAGTYRDDSGAVLTVFAEQSRCEGQPPVFAVKAGGRLELRSVSVEGILHQPRSVVLSECGQVSLLQVNFTDIVPAFQLGSVLAFVGSCGTLTYEGGTVSLLNSRYQLSEARAFRGFLSVEKAANVTIAAVQFRLNAVWNGQLIEVQDAATLTIRDCIFAGNAVATLLEVSSSEVLLLSSTLESNFLRRNGVEIYSEGAKVSDCTFRRNVAERTLISIQPLSAQSSSAHLRRLAIRDNLAASLVSLQRLSQVVFTESVLEANGNSSALLSPLQDLLASAESSVSVLPSVSPPDCAVQVSVGCSDVTLSQLAVRSSVCVGASPGLSVTEAVALLVTDLTFTGNDGPGLLSIRLEAGVVLSNLTFTGNSNSHSQAPVCLSLLTPSVSISNSTFVNNRGRLHTVASFLGVRTVTLTDVVLEGNSAESAGSGVAFVPASSGWSSFTVIRCVFKSNSAFSQGPLVVANEDIDYWSLSFITLDVRNSTFVGNFARLAGASVTLAGALLAAGSSISRSTFANNSCEEGGSGIYMDAKAGQLRVSECQFVGNQGHDGAAILYVYDALTANSSLFLAKSLFASNKGASVVQVGGMQFASLESEDCVFVNNSASAVALSSGSWSDRSSLYVRNNASEGAVLVLASASATIRDCVIANNTATVRGGVALVSSGGVLTCLNCTFRRNSCSGQGGVLYVRAKATLQFSNVTFQMNSAKSHAAVLYVHASSVAFNESRFIANEAGGYGAVVAYESTFSFYASEFRENTAAAKSPGIVTRLSTGAITSTLFQNQTGKTGAFLFATDLTTVTVSNSVFRLCTANSGGAFVVLVVTTLTIKDSVISECGAATDGGVLSCRICTTQLSGVTIRSVKSPESTGALFLLQSTLSISRSAFSQLVGSVVYAEGSTVTIDSSDFRGTRTIYGAAVDCVDCLTLNVTRSEFHDNVAKKGGALYSFTTGASAANRLTFFAQNKFENNRAVNGGAVYSESVFLTLSANSFLNNSASSSNYVSNGLAERGFGGAVFTVCSFLSYCSFEYVDNIFSNNFAEAIGGALRWFNSFPALRNNSMTGNSAPYGQDIASFAVRLALVSEDDTVLPDADLQDGVPVLAELDGIASGQLCQKVIRVALLDQYGSIVRMDSSSSAHMRTDNASGVRVYGNIQVAASLGVFQFANFTLSGPPGSTQLLGIGTDGVNVLMKTYTHDPSEYFATVLLRLKFRECLLGESLQFEECRPCPVNTFSLSPAQPCTSCPPNVVCYGTYLMVPESGYWRPDPYRNLFFECPNPDACLGSPDPKNLSLTGKCEVGYSNNLCSSCAEGYSKQAGDFCSRCPGLTSNITFSTMLLSSVLAGLALLVAISIRSATRPRSELATYMKIFMNYLQMVVVSGSLKLSWPRLVSSFLKMQSMAANASDQLLSFDCLLEAFSSQQVFFTNVSAYVLLPGVLLTLALLCWLLLRLAWRVSHVLQKTVASLVMVLFILHTSLTKAMFSVFACTELLPGEFWLTADLSIRCWDSKHTQQVLAVAVPGICVWVLGLPTLCLLVLVHSRKSLNSNETKLRFSFLYKGYKAEYFFWEFVILYRKVVLVCVRARTADLRGVLIHASGSESPVAPCGDLPAARVCVPHAVLSHGAGAVRAGNPPTECVPAAARVALQPACLQQSRSEVDFRFSDYDLLRAVLRNRRDSEFSLCLFVVIVVTNTYFIFNWAKLVLPIVLSTLRSWVTAIRRKQVAPEYSFAKRGESQSVNQSKSEEYTQSRATPNLTGEMHVAPANSFIDAEDSVQDGVRVTFRIASSSL